MLRKIQREIGKEILRDSPRVRPKERDAARDRDQESERFREGRGGHRDAGRDSTVRRDAGRGEMAEVAQHDGCGTAGTEVCRVSHLTQKDRPLGSQGRACAPSPSCADPKLAQMSFPHPP